MENTFITTKNTGVKYLASQLLSDAIFVIIGIFCQSKVEPLRRSWEFSAANTMSTIAVICFIVAFLSVIYHIMVFTTVAEVSGGKITGKGLQKIALKEFNLRYDQITEMSTSKGMLNVETGACVFLVINTVGGEYKVITTPERAKEITDHFHSVHV